MRIFAKTARVWESSVSPYARNDASGIAFLDQNRASVLLGLKLGRVTFRIGYMNRWIPGSTGTMEVHEHAALVWFNHLIPVADAPDRTSEEGNP